MFEFAGQWSVDFADQAPILAFRTKKSFCVVDFEQHPPRQQHSEYTESQCAFSVKLSPDGRRVAATGTDVGISIWETESLTKLGEFDKDHRYWSTVWSPTGRYLAAGGSGGHIGVWDSTSQEEIMDVYGHENTVWDLEFSADESLLATCSTDNLCKVWNVADARLVQSLMGHSGEVTSVAFELGNQRLLTVGLDGQLTRWQVNTNHPANVLPHTAPTSGVAFSKDGMRVATACGDGQLRLWQTQTGKLERTINAHSPTEVSCVFASFQSQDAVISTGGDGWVRIWGTQNGELMKEIEGRLGAGDPPPLSLGGNGRFLAFARSFKDIGIWDLHKDLLWKTIPADRVRCCALSPETKYLAISGGTHFKIWDFETETFIVDQELPLTNHIAFSSNGRQIALASHDRRIRMFELSKLVQRPKDYVPRVLEGTPATVYATTFSPDGKTLFSSSDEPILRIWDVVSGKERCILPGHQSGVVSLAISTDGRTLASASFDKTVRLWRAPLNQNAR